MTRFLFSLIFALVSTSASAVELTKELIQSANNIVLYIGTFNPIHNGHLVNAEVSISEFGADLVILLPHFAKEGKQPLHIIHRLQIINATVEDSPQKNQIAYPTGNSEFYPLLRKGVPEVVKKIREYNPKAVIYDLIGEDIALDQKRFLEFHQGQIKPDRYLIAPRSKNFKLNVDYIPKDKVTILQGSLHHLSSTNLKVDLDALYDPFSGATNEEFKSIPIKKKPLKLLMRYGFYQDQKMKCDWLLGNE